LLVKADGLSRLTDAAPSLYIDKHTCEIIDGILVKFLWKNKSHYLKKIIDTKFSTKGWLKFN